MAKNILDIYNEKVTGKYSDLFISIMDNIEEHIIDLDDNFQTYDVYSVIPYKYNHFNNKEWEEAIKELNKGWILEELEGDIACTAIMNFISYLWYDKEINVVIVHIISEWYWNYKAELRKTIPTDTKDLN